MDKENFMPTFGPAGCCNAFAAEGGKHTKDIFPWLAKMGLDAFEYQCGNGIRAGDKALSEIGVAAKKAGIRMSLHAPYFISLSGIEKETRLKSLEYIRASLHAAELLGAYLIVIHTGSAAKLERREAMRLAADTLTRAIEEFGDSGIKLGLETMGKKNQLGTPEEVLELCKISPRLAPVFDMGHINARSCGTELTSTDSFRRLFCLVADRLGDNAAKELHCHFSRIEYTAAGEKKHLNFEDEGIFGPDHRHFAEAIRAEKLSPRVICESAGNMSIDALAIKKYYLSL